MQSMPSKPKGKHKKMRFFVFFNRSLRACVNLHLECGQTDNSTQQMIRCVRSKATLILDNSFEENFSSGGLASAEQLHIMNFTDVRIYNWCITQSNQLKKWSRECNIQFWILSILNRNSMLNLFDEMFTSSEGN